MIPKPALVTSLLLIVLAIVLVSSNSVFAQQGGPSVYMSTGYTEPAYLGQTMNIWVIVQNQASIPMQVTSVTVSLDWYQTLTGNTPKVLQAGEKQRWEFDNVTIPSTTWTGEHSSVASIMVGWADSSGGWSHTLSSPLTSTTNFAVQQQPSPQEGYTTCNQNGCFGFNEPGYTTPIAPVLTNNGAPDYSGVIIALLLVVVAVLVVVVIIKSGEARSKPARPP